MNIKKLLEVARIDEREFGHLTGRRSLSEATFGVRSARDIPCPVCGRKIQHFHFDDATDGFPLEKGHKKACSEHPRTKHPEEWRRKGRS